MVLGDELSILTIKGCRYISTTLRNLIQMKNKAINLFNKRTSLTEIIINRLITTFVLIFSFMKKHYSFSSVIGTSQSNKF